MVERAWDSDGRAPARSGDGASEKLLNACPWPARSA